MNHPSDLAGRYAVAVDERDAVALAAVFTTDAEFVRPPGLTRDAGASVTTGADAIAAAILGSVSHLHGTRHAVHQQVIDIDGDTAGGTVYCLAHHLYRGREGMRDDAIAVRVAGRHPDVADRRYGRVERGHRRGGEVVQGGFQAHPHRVDDPSGCA